MVITDRIESYIKDNRIPFVQGACAKTMGVCYSFRYISSGGNGIKTYISFMEKYKEVYGTLPKKTPADVGYGNYDNYSYCKENKIELYMKYSGYYKEKEKRTKKNQFKVIHFKRDENNQFVCPAGHSFEVEKETMDRGNLYPRKNKTLINRYCQE